MEFHGNLVCYLTPKGQAFLNNTTSSTFFERAGLHLLIVCKTFGEFCDYLTKFKPSYPSYCLYTTSRAISKTGCTFIIVEDEKYSYFSQWVQKQYITLKIPLNLSSEVVSTCPIVCQTDNRLYMSSTFKLESAMIDKYARVMLDVYYQAIKDNDQEGKCSKQVCIRQIAKMN